MLNAYLLLQLRKFSIIVLPLQRRKTIQKGQGTGSGHGLGLPDLEFELRSGALKAMSAILRLLKIHILSPLTFEILDSLNLQTTESILFLFILFYFVFYFAVSTEPDVGLKVTNYEIMT